MKHIFLDFDRTLFNTDQFYTALELAYVENIENIVLGYDLSRFLYTDVTNFLQSCHKQGFVCHLVTAGNKNVQECKFIRSGIETYFQDLFYVEQGSKAEVIQKYLKKDVSCESVVFVDDTISHVEDFAQLIPGGLPIRMRRKGAKGSELDDDRFQTISQLDECFVLMTA